ncbi:hypothetical protein V6M85_02130 [Sulfolobus tengchongensis]|uniref:Uncharacterized protein n=1 Tax=Sulfolobus tengchongensis TaxID=207809 RepID=A0AAX4L1U3_9CREN
MKYYLTIIGMALNILVALIPQYWWYYSAGGIIIIKDSLFFIGLELLGKEYLIVTLINYFLFAFRFYVVSVALYYIYLAIKGIKRSYLLIAWVSYLYILDPLIFYIVFNYVINIFVPARYPLFIIGSENMSINYQGVKIMMLIESYPTLTYWIALATGTINLIARYLKL